jgi:predicted MPP superfamily phosphohydrolase
MGHVEEWMARGRGGRHWENVAWVRWGIRAGLAALGLSGRARRNALSPVLRRVVLRLDRLPPAFDGFRMLHLSDPHIDGLAGLDAAVSDLIDGLWVDLSVWTGDYRFASHGASPGVYPRLARVLDHVRSELGTVAVLGNHDYFEMVDGFSSLGVTTLVNQAVRIERGGDAIEVLGVDDPHYFGADDLDAAASGASDGAFKVLLVHSPELYREAAEAGVDLYLCGHTHAGQIRVPLIGAPVVNAKCPRRLTRGVWRHRGMTGFTSAGLGASGVPARLGCPPEAALIELRGTNKI